MFGFHSLIASRRKLSEFLRALGDRKYHPEKHYMRGQGPATRRKEMSAAAPTHGAGEPGEEA
jgi:hypothetical protein